MTTAQQGQRPPRVLSPRVRHTKNPVECEPLLVKGWGTIYKYISFLKVHTLGRSCVLGWGHTDLWCSLSVWEELVLGFCKPIGLSSHTPCRPISCGTFCDREQSQYVFLKAQKGAKPRHCCKVQTNVWPAPSSGGYIHRPMFPFRSHHYLPWENPAHSVSGQVIHGPEKLVKYRKTWPGRLHS